jgi:hypothetical protein
MAVWICEYPYRTMRAAGPGEECDGCPIWEALRRHRAEAHESDDADAPELPSLPMGC